MTLIKPAMPRSIDSSAGVIRAILALVLLASLIGMGVELLLMDHFEDVWMLIPLVLIGLSLVAMVAFVIKRSRMILRLFQVTMLLMIVGGGLGTLLHHRAKEEFQLEGHPDLSGMKLFWQAMRGTTPPSLAPAALIQAGLIGLAWAYRHPSCNRKGINSSTPGGGSS